MNGYIFQMALETKQSKSIIINIIMILIILFFSPWISANCTANILKFCKEPLDLMPLGGC